MHGQPFSCFLVHLFKFISGSLEKGSRISHEGYRPGIYPFKKVPALSYYHYYSLVVSTSACAHGFSQGSFSYHPSLDLLPRFMVRESSDYKHSISVFSCLFWVNILVALIVLCYEDKQFSKVHFFVFYIF